VTPPDNQLAVTGTAGNCFNEAMLVLPSGQILMSDSTRTLWVYTPTGTTAAAVAGSQPKITSVQIDPNTPGLFHVKGTGLNGINEGAYYGDDAEMASNYPIVQLTDTSGKIVYATTSNWGPGFGGNAGTSTDFSLPAGTNLSSYASFTLLANGIAATTQSLNPASIDANGKLKINAYLFAGGKVTLQLKPGDPSTLQVYNGTTLFKEFPVSSVNSIEVDRSTTLTLEFSNGNLIPGGGLALIGNDDDSKLILKGQLPSGPFGKEVSTPVGPHAGTLALDGSNITYTNLKPIIDTVTASLFTIKGTSNAETINIVDDPNGTENGYIASEVNSTGFEKIDFANKIKVTVDGVDGTDTVTVNNPNPAAGLSNLLVITGATDGSVVNVQATPATVPTTIQANGAATFNVGSLAPATGGIVDPITGQLILTDKAGKGTMNVDDTGSSVSKTGTLTSSTLTGLGMTATISYSGMNKVNINLGAGSDIFHVQSISAATTVGGGDGNDQLIVDATSGNDTIDVSGAAVNVTGLPAITYSKFESLQVNGLAGSDTFNVTSSADVAISIDSGDPVGILPGDLLHLDTDSADTVAFTPGPTSDAGSFAVNSDQPISFVHVESLTVIDPATAVINGTSGNDVIAVVARDSSYDSAADGVQDFTVSVNSSPSILFTDTPTLILHALAGDDLMTLTAPAPNLAGWNVAVTADGGPSSAIGDRLVVSAPGTDQATYTPAYANSGALGITNSNGTVANVTISDVESMVYDGQTGNDSFTMVGTSAADSFTLTPGAANDAGTLSMDSTLPVTFQNLGATGKVIVNGNGGADSLVYNGTAANDAFTIASNSSPAGGKITLNARVPVITTAIPTLALEGLAGDDTFTQVPTIAASPYSTLQLDGGTQASAAGDQANLTAGAAADIAVSGQTVSQGSNTMVGTGLENINLAGAGNRLIYNGIAGVTENISVIGSPTAKQGQVSVPGVTQVSFTNVPAFVVNGNPADSDTLAFAGTNNSDTFKINLAAAGTAADPVLKLQTTATAALLLTLQNYTGFQTLNVKGLDSADTFNVYTAPTAPVDPNVPGGRNLFIDGTLPSGKKKGTNVLHVYYLGQRPKIVQTVATQNPTSGQIKLDYGTAVYLVGYAGIQNVTIGKQ
jgi:hypothetical protein